jgi:hypothetical protein
MKSHKVDQDLVDNATKIAEQQMQLDKRAIPQNATAFEKDWRALKNDAKAFYLYLTVRTSFLVLEYLCRKWSLNIFKVCLNPLPVKLIGLILFFKCFFNLEFSNF